MKILLNVILLVVALIMVCWLGIRMVNLNGPETLNLSASRLMSESYESAVGFVSDTKYQIRRNKLYKKVVEKIRQLRNKSAATGEAVDGLKTVTPQTIQENFK